MKVPAAIMMIPAQLGTLLLTALISCAPTMTLTEDHPRQARQLKMATGFRQQGAFQTHRLCSHLLSFTP